MKAASSVAHAFDSRAEDSWDTGVDTETVPRESPWVRGSSSKQDDLSGQSRFALESASWFGSEDQARGCQHHVGTSQSETGPGSSECERPKTPKPQNPKTPED